MKFFSIVFLFSLLFICQPCVGQTELAYTLTGKASYYSKTFKGKSTASGETYDPNDYTCAHKSLPFGTYIRVKRGNRSTLVRVIDRGPHIKGRIVDLSYAAAQEIGLDRAGVGEVTIEIVDINTLPIHQSN